DDPADVGISSRVPGHARVAARIGRMVVEQLKLPERRCLITPVPGAVEAPGVAAVVEPDPRVVLAGDEVRVVERVDRQHLTRLGTERAVLNDSNIDLSVPGELVLTALAAFDLDP